MFKNLRKKKKGFTLIELIIVIAILAILAAVAIPRLGNVTKTANSSADKANAKTIANAVSILQAEGKITEDGTFILDADDDKDDISTIIEGYLQNVPKTSGDGKFTVFIANGIVTVTDGTNPLFPAQ